jgi:nicotinamide-nucleotide amidase
LSRPSASILLTGNELLRGVIADRNGAFLARALEELGFALRRTLVVGDDAEDVDEGLRLLLSESDLVVTSGGLGPTHDDRTVEAVAAVAGAPLVLDEGVLARIGAWTDRIAVRRGVSPEGFRAGNRKQAHIPAGAHVLGLAGTAPGLVVEAGERRIVVLPGVPSELRRLWARVPEQPSLAAMLSRARPRRRLVLRTYGIGESHVADAFNGLGGDPAGVETSICARNFEIEVDLRVEPGHEEAGERLWIRLGERLDEYVFATDERPLAAIVADMLRERGLALAAAESCTGGMVAARMTDPAGASDVFVGGVVAYSDGLKRALLDVPADVLARHGAVSAEAAEAMARGAIARLGADVAVAVTGVAGPGGGSEQKPVGLVFLHVASTDGGARAERLDWPGSREDVRARATVAALHLVRAHLGTLPTRPGG